MAKRRSNLVGRAVLLGLLGLFALPIVLAYWLNRAPEALPRGTTNHGTLLEQVMPLAVAGLAPLDGAALPATYFLDHWTLVYLAGADCDAPCRADLERLQRVRAALGKEAYRVQRMLVVRRDPAPDARLELMQSVPGFRMARADPSWLSAVAAAVPETVSVTGSQTVSQTASSSGARPTLLVDPQANLLLVFDAAADPGGLLKDLKRLLKLSKIG